MSVNLLDRLAAALADRYRIERELGQGGMARVFLAEDVKHHRKVALKVLKPELAAVLGAERFVQEITTTAALQHPHILALFDSGQVEVASDSHDSRPTTHLYYVMPFIDGETLRAKLDRETQLGIDEALKIAIAVADALDYAHRHGVIHRDIKPENILLHDGRPMVADFGIALALSAAAGGRMTETGMSLGTPHYMSPEQATADKEITGRSDIYSLASVLYEMLTGNPPHTGSSAQQIIMKIIAEQPAAVTQYRKSVPPNVAAAVAKALEKLPADRFATAAEFAAALTDRSFTTAARAASVAPVQAARRALPWALCGVAVLGMVLFAVLWWRRPLSASGDVVRAILELPTGTALSYPSLALARDGSRIIVSGRLGDKKILLQRTLDQLAFAPVPGSEDGNRQFLSPDGKWVAFTTGKMMRKVPLDGGPAADIAPSTWAGGDWTASGIVIYTPNYLSGLWSVPVGGGAPRQLTVPDSTRGELAHWWPQMLPDGDHVLFTAFSTPIERARIEVLSLKTGKRNVLLDGAVSARYVTAGYLLYAKNEALYAVPFDVGSLKLTGPAVPVIQDVALATEDGRAGFSVSDNGTLAYISASGFDPDLDLVWVNRRGEPGPPVTAPARFSGPAISPDGRSIAIAIARPGEPKDVWVLDLTRGTRTALTNGGANDFGPRFTPDGGRVIFQSEQPVFDLHVRAADASSPATPLLVSPFDKDPGSVTPDGTSLLFRHGVLPHSEIWTIPLDGTGTPASVLRSDAGDLFTPRLAPNGRWLAYASDESGRDEVYLSPYPAVTSARRQVSADGGVNPHWTRGGRELVYRHGQRMMAVAVDPRSGQLGTPEELFLGPFESEGITSSYDVSPEGERFLMLRRAAGAEPRQVIIVTNWFKELRRLVPVK